MARSHAVAAKEALQGAPQVKIATNRGKSVESLHRLGEMKWNASTIRQENGALIHDPIICRFLGATLRPNQWLVGLAVR